jgi:GAF domain-containing protein
MKTKQYRHLPSPVSPPPGVAATGALTAPALSRLSYRVRYAVFGALFGLMFPLASSLLWVYMNRLSLTLGNLLLAQTNNPLQWMIDSAPLFLGWFASFAGLREDRLTSVNQELENRLNERSRLLAELETMHSRLELQVSKQIAQLRMTAQVASETVHTKELQQTMDMLVRLISERLGFYHSGIFLLDDTHEYAVLRAASSKGGQVMLTRNHRLQVGHGGMSSVGIVGYVAAKGESRVAHDVGQDAAYFNNPDLPATRSEVALPLRIGERVIGVLDIQSVKMGDFNPEDVAVLQTMADQISLVIENTRLSRERREALQQLREFQARQSKDAWRSVLANRSHGVVYDGMSIHALRLLPPASGPTPAETTPTGEPDPVDGMQAADSGGSNRDGRVLRQKILYQNIPIGTLVLSKPPDRGAWNETEKKFVQSVAAQIALAVENARLLDENQRQAQSEQIIGAISARAQSSLDLDAVMKISVQEIAKALGASRVEMRLDPESPPILGPSQSTGQLPGNGHIPVSMHGVKEG